MKRCPNCMREHKDSARFCPYCGYDIHKPVDGSQLPPGTLLKTRYMIGTVIKQGGFGMIYRAWDTTLDVVVAIKECFPTGLISRNQGETYVNIPENQTARQVYEEKIRRFLGEAQTMARFSDHANMVHVFDYFEENRTAYFVMEYLDGENIEEYCASHTLSVDESVDIIVKVCSIIKCMHKENIIHRDLKPENIMICKDGNIKLIDFGTARAQFGELSKTVSADLTPGYAPFEQYSSKGHQGSWTDVYALCATLYYMVTGVKPEEATDRAKEDTLAAPRQRNANVPEWLDRTIMAGMAIDYHLRLQNIDELLSGLEQNKKILYPEEKIRKQKFIRSIYLTAAVLVLLFAGGGYIAHMASYHAWFVKNGTITVWAPDNATGRSMAESSDIFEERYSGKQVEFTFVKEDAYFNEVSEAAANRQLPDVFILPEGDLAFGHQLADISSLLNRCGDSDHFLIKDNCEYLSEQKFIPLSFDTIVLYENTSVSSGIDTRYDMTENIDLSQTKPLNDPKHTLFDSASHLVTSVMQRQNGSEGTQNALTEFTEANHQIVPYYFGSTSERHTIQNALAGYNEIHGVCDGNVMYADFCDKLSVSKSAYEDNSAIVDLFIRYLLSEDAQSDMYLRNDKPLPIEKNSYSHYVSTIESLSFLKDEYDCYKIVE